MDAPSLTTHAQSTRSQCFPPLLIRRAKDRSRLESTDVGTSIQKKRGDAFMASPADPLRHPGAGTPPSTFEEATYRKVSWRLVPLLMLCYVVAYLDRVNVGFAKLQMTSDLGLSDAVYGFGAGIFFLGYFIFEIPSNVILHKVG